MKQGPDRAQCRRLLGQPRQAVHGKSREDCTRVVRTLIDLTGVTQYEILFSEKELKKTSMAYF